MSVDSFDSSSRQFSRHTAHMDGLLIEKALHDNAFQVKFALQRSQRHMTRPDGHLGERCQCAPGCLLDGQDGDQMMLTISTAIRTGRPDGHPCVVSWALCPV